MPVAAVAGLTFVSIRALELRTASPVLRIRCAKVVGGIFPDRPSIVRLVGAVLAEQNDESAVACRKSVDSIAKALADPTIEPEEVIAIAQAA